MNVPARTPIRLVAMATVAVLSLAMAACSNTHADAADSTSTSTSTTASASPSTTASTQPSLPTVPSGTPVVDRPGIAAIRAVYFGFLASHVPGAKRTVPSGLASDFVSKSVLTAAWGSTSASTAPLVCGLPSIRIATIGTPSASGSTETVSVTLWHLATAEDRQAVVTVDRTSHLITKVACRNTVADPAHSSVAGKALSKIMSFYGPYATGTASQANTAGGHETTYFTSTFLGGPHQQHENPDVADFDQTTCSQDQPGVFTIDSIAASGKTATLQMTVDAGQTNPVTYDGSKISLVDCAPLPSIPTSAGSAKTSAKFVNAFFSSYETLWGFRSFRPVKQLIAPYFTSAKVLDSAWTDAHGLAPKGCTSGKPYVDIEWLQGGDPQVSGSHAVFKLGLLDTAGNMVGTGTVTVDLTAMKISAMSC
jgi:hypothetical protein